MKLNNNVAEATRLTRQGRLTEALARLMENGAPDLDARTPEEEAHIDMTQSSDGQWRAAFDGHEPASATNAKIRTDLADMVRRYRGSVGTGPMNHAGPSVPPGARFEYHTSPGVTAKRRYKLYVPSKPSMERRALMVMLHGCTQDPDDFAAGTAMNDLAEAHGFLVLYPEQPSAANANKCWNWFKAGDQRRDAGEPDLVARMIKDVMDAHAIDPGQVFVAGLSAGAAMAAILGARYPDLISGVAVHSGLAVGVAHDMPSAFAAMNHGANTTPSLDFSTPLIVFHGDADATVNSRNGQQVVHQAINSRALKRTVSRGQAGHRQYTRTVFAQSNDVVSIEYWVLHGAGHAWSGGKTRGSFTDPNGPDASAEIVRFFLNNTAVG